MKLAAQCWLSLATALLTTQLCYADPPLTPLPQSTPPQIDEQTKQLIRDSFQPVSDQASAKAATAKFPSNVAISTEDLRAHLNRDDPTGASHIESQRQYHEKVRREFQASQR